MVNNKINSDNTAKKEKAENESAAQNTAPVSHFKRQLVPLDEYAARQGLSSDVIEQQGQLGVIQIRKYKGRKYVVDVPPEQLDEYLPDESEDAGVLKNDVMRPGPAAGSKLFTAGLIIGVMVIVISVFWLYMESRQKLDYLNAEYISLQDRYDELSSSTQNVKDLKEELSSSKDELAQIQYRIAASKADLEKIQADLNRARRNLDTIQSELSGIQGQVSLSKVEIESVQNTLKDSKEQLENAYDRNSQPAKQ